nr:RpoL/Rpb11 RNA polymerase subunit family protein [Candidatus Sigynarchaeota archaeon]
MSGENNDDSIPLEEKLIKDEEIRPKTPKEIEREREKDAKAKRLIFVKPVGGAITTEEASLEITDESHGFCNALKTYLLKNEHVLFASYKKEFGIDPTLYVNSDGKVAVIDALIQATDLMMSDLKVLSSQVDAALEKIK